MTKRLFMLSMVAAGAVSFASCEGGAGKTAEMKSVDWSAMDKTVKPTEDFYQFANGTWIKEKVLPPSEARYGSFNEVKDRNDEIIKKMLQEAAASTDHKKGSSEQLIGDFYAMVMDSTKRDEMGYEPIKPEMERIMNATIADFPALFAYQDQYGIGGAFSFGVQQDLKDNSLHAIYAGQGGQGLPDKDYYFKDDEKAKETREKYLAHIEHMFTLVGMSAEDAKKHAANAMHMETRFADASMNRVQRRNIHAQYNKFAYNDFKALAPNFDWDTYKNEIGLTADVNEVIVSQPDFVKRFNEMLTAEPLEHWQSYLMWGLVRSTASKLSTELEEANFAFYGTYMRGTKELKPRWKRGVDAVTGYIGEPLGAAYVEKNFSPEAKQKVLTMVSNLGDALRMRLEGLDWMSDSTKMQAYRKMGAFTKKLGYPDKWKDYSSMNIGRESYLANTMAVTKFAVDENIAKYGEPIDKTEWGMPAHMVNAYYNPLWNEIVFPAGIMQPPFFDPNAEDAVNYARMGAVIGHEMIHGFDDQGSNFDADGLMANWWTAEDGERFKERTDKLKAQYDAYEVLPGVNVNGQLTLGENIADFGGLTMAYYAYMKSIEGKDVEVIDGFTPEQRFFIAYGQIWKGKATDEFLDQQVKTDPHSPTMFRVNGPLSNMPEFYAAFDVKEGDPMRQEDPAKIW